MARDLSKYPLRHFAAVGQTQSSATQWGKPLIKPINLSKYFIQKFQTSSNTLSFRNFTPKMTLKTPVYIGVKGDSYFHFNSYFFLNGT